jgi:FtsH-binding integral membrane protein
MMRKQLYEMQKGKAIEASTSVTATKSENIMLSICTVAFIAIVILAFILICTGKVAAGVIFAVAGIILVVGCLLIVFLNPKHKQERKENAEVYKGTIDYESKWNN